MMGFSGVERQERVKWTVLVPGVYVCAYVGIFFKASGKRCGLWDGSIFLVSQ